jgi:hypothetical protein
VGGGWAGGNGGPQAPYDTWGYAGYFGGNAGNLSENPNGRTPGGTGNPYWTGGVGLGGVNGGGGGLPGYAVLEFEINGTFLNSSGTYYPVKETWVKDSNIWKRATGVYLKKDGVWQPVDGTLAPNFARVGGSFGYSSRAQGSNPPPPPPAEFATSISPDSGSVSVSYGTSLQNGTSFTTSFTVTCVSGSGTTVMTATPFASFASVSINPPTLNLSAGQSATVQMSGSVPRNSITNPWTWTASSSAGGSYTYTINRV